MRGQPIGQRSAAFEHAQNVEDDEPKARPLGQFAGDAERSSSGTPALSSVESSWVKKRTSRRLRPANAGSLKFQALLRFEADVDGRQPLFAQFARDPFVVFGMQGSGAELAIGCDCFEVKLVIHLELLRHAHHFFRGRDALRLP